MEKRGKSFIAPASIFKRIIAFVIDILILDLIVLAPFDFLFQKMMPTGSISQQISYIQNNPGLLNSFYPIMIFMSIIIVFYFTYLDYKIKQTPGKMLLGLYIIPEKKNRTFWNYLLSNITFVVARLFIIVWIIDFFYMISSPKNQRLTQKLNKILIVQDYPKKN